MSKLVSRDETHSNVKLSFRTTLNSCFFVKLFVNWIKIKTNNFERFPTTNILNIESVNSLIEKRVDVKEIGYCMFTFACFLNQPIVVRVSRLPSFCLANKIAYLFVSMLGHT